ncbi:HlyD family efflux transporter periplasmic adaptor subunit [Parachitinimonas caeni]|uniref:AprE-like beta-barrel domain-containing protein n=1 Tax=Parachitinimonas caeni TaxID=3031301 RepID=A0ABT7DXK0_9NEIS|nr:HlyD family efflux transporter periplasmic adaptor subunit [Parachitinimonas caeni]MDK2123895.1 hypothetical protein [Parachitinimonas caeni]
MSRLANRLFKALSEVQSIEKFILLSATVFLVFLFLLLKAIPVVDYMDNVKGKISSSTPPLRILSNGQYHIKKVHVAADQYVRKGDLLVDFDNTQILSEFSQVNTEMARLQRDLQFSRDQSLLMTEKIVLNEKVIAEKERLRVIGQKKNALTMQFDAEKKLSTEQIKSLSNKLLTQLIPRLEDTDFSTMEKLRILSNAHANLRQINDLSAQIQNNSYLPEETDRKAAIEVANLRKENVDLKLSMRNGERQLQQVESELLKLKIRRETLQMDLEKMSIRSPASGYIVNLSPNMRHSNLVKSGEEILAIHDEGAPLEAEVVLTDEQYKETHLGQKVNIELFAWNHYRHGIVPGEITFISRDKIIPNTVEAKIPVFTARVKISRSPGLDIKMGYDFRAKIILGEITLLDYMLKKLNFMN